MLSVLRRIIRPRRLLPAIQFAFTAAGRPWRDFYAWWLDRQERGNSLANIRNWRPDLLGYERGFFDLSRGQYHLAFMIRHGLKKSDHVLDFGCGFGRTASALVPWLDPGRYVGVDLSKERLRIAREWIAELGVDDRQPRFVLSSDIDIKHVASGSIDVIWTQAVISHMPIEDVRRFFFAAARILKPDGMMLFDYVLSKEGFKRHTIKDFFYEESTIRTALSDAGLSMEPLADWDDDIEPEKRVPNEVLVRARLIGRGP